MSDEGLGALIYGDEGRSYRQPDWEWIHQELKIKGVTRQLLFEEYQAQGGQCYRLFAVLRSLQQMAEASEALHASSS